MMRKRRIERDSSLQLELLSKREEEGRERID
jgi:hypothetical protein